MSKKISSVIALAAIVVGGGVASAHPGHGEFGQGQTIRHYSTEVLHLLPWVLVAAFAVSVVLFRRRRNTRRS